MRHARRSTVALVFPLLLAACSGGGGGSGAGTSAPPPATTTEPGATTAATTIPAPAAAPTTTVATTTTALPVAVDAPCPNGTTGRCGTVTVPLDRSNPGAGTVDISFAFIPRADASRPAKGTLLGLSGGPGLATLNAPEGWVAWAGTLDGYDLLLTDYRGTGRSGALHCATQDSGFPSEIEAARTAVETCGKEFAERAAFYDTAATADDLEAVRTALGLGPLDVLGLSYGTYVAQVFASRHPVAVRSVVLDGVVPRADPVTGDGEQYSVPNLRAAVEALQTMCTRSNGACSPEQVTADLQAVVEQVRSAPSPGLPEEVVLARVLIDPSTLRELPAALRAAAGGDRTRLEGLAQPFLIKPTGDGSFGPAEEFSAALTTAVACNDFIGEFESPDRAAREQQVAAEIAALPSAALAPFTAEEWVRLVDGNAGYRSLCVGWPVPEAASGDEQAAPLPEVPVLVMNGDVDVITPLAGAEQVAAAWPGAVLVRFPNAGHTTLLTTGCAITVVDEFVQTLAVADTEMCVAGAPPLVPAS